MRFDTFTSYRLPFNLISSRVSPQTDSTGFSSWIPCGQPYKIASLAAVYDSLHLINTSLSVSVGATQQRTWPLPIRFPSTLKPEHGNK